MSDPCCEQAILKEEGACPAVRMPCGGSGRMRRSCRGGLDLAAASLNAAQLLGVNPGSVSLPTAGAGKEAQGHLQEGLAWLLEGK